MAVRLKTRWHRSKRSRRNIESSSKPKTVEKLAGVIAFNIWKLAQETFRHMDKEGFTYTSDEQVMGVITEVIAFLVQVADRMVYGHLDDDERSRFVNEMARNLVRTMQANQEEIYGDGDYGSPFIKILNERFATYAECSYDDKEGPGYAFKRVLGEKVFEAMSTTDNKWVIEHIMEFEVPTMLTPLRRMVTDIMGLRKSSKTPA